MRTFYLDLCKTYLGVTQELLMSTSTNAEDLQDLTARTS